ncbi:septal ring lytic transglycosylase RlpA family protein [Bradyrhizobium sp. CB82]|uniref:septal ring lytic transglycosylase RlpA family protein n=1 Tax=Bradyrhizobium sp. CB82 TaxID=3039159 RepID=UPI0024B1D0DB|nr:septal ring lytic transglycosylase RlpA family protein [Bradyrhizobium sp. CB82]WFU43211.1 septal ring lytic transglycosylase RlpA family protein [Bradyrhizobium sp. CB82]
MSRFECARTVHQIGASRGSRGQAARLVLAVIGAASLAACAQSPVARQKSEFATASRQAVAERHREPRKLAGVYARPRHRSPVRAVETHTASQGVASFYSDDQETASGEKFDKRELTAAHPTLPFGTRLRVTNVSTGRSVTVRVNDRGPYVRGRVVDVSYSAAEALGMINKGVANVKLDVMQ